MWIPDWSVYMLISSGRCRSDLYRHGWRHRLCHPQSSRGRCLKSFTSHGFVGENQPVLESLCKVTQTLKSHLCTKKVCLENKQSIAALKSVQILKRTCLIPQNVTFWCSLHVCSMCIWCWRIRVYVCTPGKASPGSRLVVVVVGVGEGGRPLGPEQSSPWEAAWSPFKFL